MMVMVKVAPDKALQLGEHLKARQVLVLARSPMRLVTHLDVAAAGIERALAGFRSFLGSGFLESQAQSR